MTEHPDGPHPPLRLDLAVPGGPSEVGVAAEVAERRGLDRLMAAETAHSPFLTLVRAAERTRSVELATGVAIAFARTPMSLAYEAWGLHEMSGGRAVIGLGSQIKPHVVRRYGMPWDRPAARMREYVRAVRAIWHSWQTGERLAFRGDFYSHTLMTPAFSPGPLAAGPPPILLAGVGPRMTSAAGAVADGFIGHPFTSPGHLAGEVLPRVRAARATAEAAGEPWTRRPFEVVGSVLVATGRTAEERAAQRAGVRARLAFYASTPAYRTVVDALGLGDLQEELHRLSLRGRWTDMAGLVDDEVFRVFAVDGTPEEAAREIRRRYAGLVDRICVHGPEGADPSPLADVLTALRTLR
ncbi:TIGR03617 family F420-dependent LLM class oxidoreductase [Streptomyces sp. AJS327]|uniref:TIGR03617 family F420-dependent LLM class oxidoreductase n=1 Tax=Streptomyces sp. AJS327 TaxID=2545265 RepID=UPI0027E3DF2C|nr:TIGR03617 family F420-dependent LLM class oxidoreductase [Streptomyces sp. AJS327]